MKTLNIKTIVDNSQKRDENDDLKENPITFKARYINDDPAQKPLDVEPGTNWVLDLLNSTKVLTPDHFLWKAECSNT